MKLKSLMCLMILVFAVTVNAGVANFDDLTLSESESYWNGADLTGGFTSGSASFNNYWDDTYGEYWESFAYSNRTDTTSIGMDGQYSAIPGGAESGANYGIAFVGFYGQPTITLSSAMQLDSMTVTNNNYAYDAMLNGYGVSKKFGGASGDDEDWFKLTIEGFDANSISTGTLNFYLADYRFADNNQDYIVDDWTEIDLSLLGTVKSLEFSLDSSDFNQYGILTPAYFAMDTVVPEPATVILLSLGGLLLRRRK